MFFEELYTELGKLFFHIAAVDGKVTAAEKDTLQRLIENSWKYLENSTDRYGTDQSNLIGFVFDYELAEGEIENGLESFEKFYRENKVAFTPEIITNILVTANAIASAFHDRNAMENKEIERLAGFFH